MISGRHRRSPSRGGAYRGNLPGRSEDTQANGAADDDSQCETAAEDAPRVVLWVAGAHLGSPIETGYQCGHFGYSRIGILFIGAAIRIAAWFRGATRLAASIVVCQVTSRHDTRPKCHPPSPGTVVSSHWYILRSKRV